MKTWRHCICPYTLLLALPMLAAAATPPNPGRRPVVDAAALKRGFADPDMLYAPFIFWFWDEPLDPGKMAEMTRVMASQRFNPGYAHGRHEMVQARGLSREEWLSDRWFESFAAALSEAKKARTYLGYCDEYWWPSFQAAGRVLAACPELKAESLSWTVLDAPGGAAVNVPASFFAVAAQLDEALPAPASAEADQGVPLGSWIWHSETRDNQECVFTRTFDIPANEKVVSARLKISVDNAFVLVLDGNPIGRGDNWYTLHDIDLTPQLRPGRHELRINAKNLDGPAGVIFGLRVTLAGGRTMAIVSDGTWQVADVGAGGDTAAIAAAATIVAPAGAGPWGELKLDGASPLHIARTIRSGTLQLVGAGEPLTWYAPGDPGTAWRVYAFNRYSHPGIDGGQVNCLDERLAAAFIKIALEPYAERFAGEMGRSIPGDFIDHEGAYGWRLGWSDTLDRQYRQRYGRDIRLWMPLMVDADAEGLCAKARWEWFDLVSDLYCAQFKAVTRWHERRGMYTTAHVWEESLLAQAYAVGDHMKLLRSLTMPGQDCLGRKALRVHDFKEIESVAEFEGARATTELMGAGGFEGTAWGTFTPPFLKQAANAVTAWGMSHIIPHGVFTVRKLDGNPWPPDWYSESPMFPYTHLWTDFMRRASYVNSHGSAAADVLLYNPLESIWVLTDHALFDAARPADGLLWLYPEDHPNGRRANQIERIYTKAIQDLTDARIEFLITDRHYLGQMEVRDGRLIRRDFQFKTVVLPDLLLMPREGARKIVEFARSGGRVYALGELPSGSPEAGLADPEMKGLMDALRALPSFVQCPAEPTGHTGTWQYGPGWLTDPESTKLGLRPLLNQNPPGLESHIRFASGTFPMLQRHVRISERDFFWLVNNTGQWQQPELLLSTSGGAAEVWDCEDGSVRPVASAPSHRPGEVRVRAVFKPFEAYWLVFAPKRLANRAPEMSIPQYETLLAIEGPWHVTCDPRLQPEMEHPMAPPAELVTGVDKPLEDWKAWGLERFSGVMDYDKTIQVNREGVTVLDLGQVAHVAEVWVNGRRVGARMWGPHAFDVTSAIRPGENRVRIRVANLINNSYGDPQPSGLLGPVELRRKK